MRKSSRPPGAVRHDEGTVPDPPVLSATPGEEGLVPRVPSLRPEPRTVAHAERGTGPAQRILPLGSGLVLIGLGLGLAFVALRLRRS
ncbi:hypothetical protein [Streptomyces glaucus]|uniref:hypothetical protein n=1 Tax=Streptomyces glaucus TaxID=284029 RepID=UPI0031E1C334